MNKRDPRPTDEQIADAIEIISICAPIYDDQGGMWFSRNRNIADARFVDYGACRSFAIAARALPHLKEELKRTARNRDMWKGQCERQAARLMKLHEALRQIANGDGFYGAQAREYKQIAQEALGHEHS